MMIEIDMTCEATSQFQQRKASSSSSSSMMVKQLDGHSQVADEHSSSRTELTEVTDEFLPSDLSFSNYEDDELELEEEGEEQQAASSICQHVERREEEKEEESCSVSANTSVVNVIVSRSTMEQEQLPTAAATTTTATTRRSILRRHSEPIPICDNSNAWKVLPKPDMARVLLSRSVSNPEDGSFFDKHAPPKSRRTSSGVVFKDVWIREYDQTVGDNPCVSYGPPISLDWDYEEFESVTLDEYEGNRGQRRTLRQMILSYYQRRNLLAWQYGVSEQELKLAKHKANKCKSQRSMTNFLIPVMMVETALESARRKAQRAVGGGGKHNKPPKTN
jgi:hypothetical protein